MFFNRVCPAILVAVLALPAAAKPHSQEHWYEFLFAGKKVGHHHTEERIQRQGERTVVYSRHQTLVEVARGSDTVRMRSTLKTWCLPDGTPLRFEHERTEGRDTRRVRGSVAGQKMEIEIVVGTQVTKKTVPMGKDVVLASSLDYLARKNLRPGFKRQGKALSEEEGELLPFEFVVSRGPGKTPFKLKSSLGPIKSDSWLDRHGVVARTRIPLMNAELRRATREEALKLSDLVDIFAKGQFSLEVPLPPRNEIRSLVVALTGPSGVRPPALAGPRHRVKAVSANQVEVHITAEQAPKRMPQLPIKPPEALAPFLEGTPYETLDDPRLKSTASRLAGGSRNAWEVARRINRFVYGHIRDKSLAKAFSSASEAIKSREGDCTEHSVLFSALAKISGIPTRLVTGLVYVGGRQQLFGYHEWVEVWMDGRWIGMDPTFGQDLADATHIRFSEGRSDPEGLREAGVAAASLVGNLKLRVRSYGLMDGSVKHL